MSSEQYRRELAQLVKEAGKLRGDMAAEEDRLAKARASAGQKRASARRASAQSSRDSYDRQAEAEEKKIPPLEKKIAGLVEKLAANMTRQNSRTVSLRSAERTEQAAKDRLAENRLRKEKSERESRDKADARRRQGEKDHAREIARLSRPTVHHVFVREPEPERLRVLYLTASPATPGREGLRVDAEVNGVLKALRGARHRDLIELHQRPAATIQDLVDGINDHRPHVVHFSGHAGGGLLFDDADVADPGEQLVGYQAIADILAATDMPPALIVLNGCHTDQAAEEMLRAAPVVIANSDEVDDASAAIFAAQFYGALAAAQTVGASVRQARAIISVALPDEPDVIVVLAAEGVDPDEVQLVRPTG